MTLGINIGTVFLYQTDLGSIRDKIFQDQVEKNICLNKIIEPHNGCPEHCDQSEQESKMDSLPSDGPRDGCKTQRDQN